MTQPLIELRCPECDGWGNNPDRCATCGYEFDDETCYELRGYILERVKEALRLTPKGFG